MADSREVVRWVTIRGRRIPITAPSARESASPAMGRNWLERTVLRAIEQKGPWREPDEAIEDTYFWYGHGGTGAYVDLTLDEFTQVSPSEDGDEFVYESVAIPDELLEAAAQAAGVDLDDEEQTARLMAAVGSALIAARGPDSTESGGPLTEEEPE